MSIQRSKTEVSFSDTASDNLYTQPATKRSATWKSAAGSAHGRTMSAYEAEAPPVPKECNNWKVYLITVILCFGAAAYGYDTGFFGGTIALPSFRAAFGYTNLTAKQRSNVSANLVSLFQAGSFFGAGAQWPMSAKYGRKWSIIVANVIFVGSAIVQTFANGSTATMMGGRFMGGFSIGIISLVVPVYLAEFAPPNIRGRLVGFFDIFIQIGTLGGFWINYGVAKNWTPSKFQWQFPIIVQLFPAAVLFIGAFFVPESPRWLLSKGRNEQAEKNLCWLRSLPSSHPYLAWELNATKQEAEVERMLHGEDTLWTSLKALATARGHRNRQLIGMGLIMFKTFSGIQAVNYYSPQIFESLGFTGATTSLFATGILGTVKFVCTLIFGFFIVDRIGRRRPLLFGSVALPLCLFYLGGYLTAVGPRGANVARTAGDYSAIVAIFLYAALYCFGWNSIPLTLISEIFSMRFRILSMTICLMWQWLVTFAVVRIMPIALTTITTRTYFVFASIFMSGGIFVYFLIPETKGLPLEYMDQLFGGIERSDLEKAIVSDAEKPQTQHLESAPRNGTTPVVAPIREE